MLFICPVKAGKGQDIPAVTHVDGTARFHTVERETNPLYWEVINEFGKLTGVPVVLNTSFNARGEPIVNTPKEAIRCFFSVGLDVLIMGNYVVYKEGSKCLDEANGQG
jgi:carbamoyltransferase